MKKPCEVERAYKYYAQYPRVLRDSPRAKGANLCSARGHFGANVPMKIYIFLFCFFCFLFFSSRNCAQLLKKCSLLRPVLKGLAPEFLCPIFFAATRLWDDNDFVIFMAISNTSQ